MRKYYADITKGLTAAAQQNHRREVGDPAGEAATLSNMALLSARMERVPEAIGRTIFFPGYTESVKSDTFSFSAEKLG
jgi:hypothetical protein